MVISRNNVSFSIRYYVLGKCQMIRVRGLGLRESFTRWKIIEDNQTLGWGELVCHAEIKEFWDVECTRIDLQCTRIVNDGCSKSSVRISKD